MTDSYQCPNCGSEHIQLLRLVYEAGTTYGSGSDGGEVNVTTFHQTPLAYKCRPPDAPKFNALGIFGGSFLAALLTMVPVIVVACWLNSIPDWIAGLLIPLMVGYLILFIVLENRRYNGKMAEHRERMNQYERAWFCHKCSNAWFREQCC